MQGRFHDADSALPVREARRRYFAANGLGEDGYESRWVKLQAGPVPLYFPNTAGRVRAVRIHDVHHVLTGYATSWTGEAEIGAWEIASGCADHHAAWILNLQAMAIGLALAPRAVFRAFARGRHSRNLYRGQIDDAVLASAVGVLRRRLALDAPPARPTGRDALLFVGAALSGVGVLLGTVALPLTLAALFAMSIR
jgi:hypothetical protein